MQEYVNIIKLDKVHRVSMDNINPVLSGIWLVVKRLNLGCIVRIEFGKYITLLCTNNDVICSKVTIDDNEYGKVYKDATNELDHGTEIKFNTKEWDEIGRYYDSKSPLVMMP